MTSTVNIGFSFSTRNNITSSYNHSHIGLDDEKGAPHYLSYPFIVIYLLLLASTALRYDFHHTESATTIEILLVVHEGEEGCKIYEWTSYAEDIVLRSCVPLSFVGNQCVDVGF